MDATEGAAGVVCTAAAAGNGASSATAESELPWHQRGELTPFPSIHGAATQSVGVSPAVGDRLPHDELPSWHHHEVPGNPLGDRKARGGPRQA